MSAARVTVRRPSGAVAVFLADECVVDYGAVIAYGRWKDLQNRPAREFVWPISQVLEIRREVTA